MFKKKTLTEKEILEAFKNFKPRTEEIIPEKPNLWDYFINFFTKTF